MQTLSRKAATGILIAMSMYLPAALAAEKSFDRTLSVNGPVTLHVSTGSGYIHVSPGSDNQVHIVGHVKGNNVAGSVARLTRLSPRSPTILQLIRRAISFAWGTSTAAIFFTMSPLTTRSRPQPIPCWWLRAARATFSSPISVVRSRRTLGRAPSTPRSWALVPGSNTGSGSIDANNLMGSTTLQTGSGEINAGLASAGDVVASTGSGTIKLSNVQGALKAETGSGSLEISGQPTAPWKLETGSGDISLRLGNSHFTLDAETGSGSVKSDPPFTMTTHGSTDKHHVNGTVNGGGPTIKAQTGSGDIHIQ